MHLDNEKRCTIEKRFKANQEGRTNTAMFSKKPSTSRQWPPFKNPRIVRVPRSSGSKDRHSKVSTIRGLRDRRIRLSVQTAIQLYELQDMLGFGQPSKVIDWLIEASKDDIDKLPPLPFTPQGISHLHQQMHTIASQGNSCFLANSGIKNDTNTSYDHSNMMPTWKFREMEASMKARNKNVDAALQENEIKQVSAQNLFPMSQYPSLPTALNNNVLMPYNNSFYHWEPPNLSLSEFQNHNDQNPYASSANALALQPSLAFPSGNQLLFCPPAGFLQCPPSITNSSESNRRQVFEPLQFLSSSSQQVLPLSLNVNPWFINLQNNADNSVKHGTGS